MIREFCAENFTHIPQAIKNGATRIELCDNLSVGGTTVSYGVMKHTVDYCHQRKIPVMAIIRPRGGNFIYSATEINMMIADIDMAKQLNVDGLVLGCLTKKHQLDTDTLITLLKHAQGKDITFHMAFDQLNFQQQKVAIDWLSEHGITRILTHGGDSAKSIETHFTHLKKLIDYAAGRIIILPGGGISYENAQTVIDSLKVHEIHGTKIVTLN